MTTFPAHAIRSCAWNAGAWGMLVRQSDHSFTGWVVEAKFSQDKIGQARGFAQSSASAIGIAVAVRRNGRGWAVSVPCSIV